MVGFAYFRVASETACDVMQVYVQAPLGTLLLLEHNFEKYSTVQKDFVFLPVMSAPNDDFHCGPKPKVFVDDLIGVIAPSSQEQLTHEH